MKTKRIKAELVRSDACELLDYLALPADAESYERMVKQIARAMATEEGWQKWHKSYRYAAIAALKSIGITAPKGGYK